MKIKKYLDSEGLLQLMKNIISLDSEGDGIAIDVVNHHKRIGVKVDGETIFINSEGNLESAQTNIDKKTIILDSEGKLSTRLGGYVEETSDTVELLLTTGVPEINSEGTMGAWDYSTDLYDLENSHTTVTLHVKGTFFGEAVDKDVDFNYSEFLGSGSWRADANFGGQGDLYFTVYPDYVGAGNYGFIIDNHAAALDLHEVSLDSVKYIPEGIIHYADPNLINVVKSIYVASDGSIQTVIGGYKDNYKIDRVIVYNTPVYDDSDPNHHKFVFDLSDYCVKRLKNFDKFYCSVTESQSGGMESVSFGYVYKQSSDLFYGELSSGSKWYFDLANKKVYNDLGTIVPTQPYANFVIKVTGETNEIHYVDNTYINIDNETIVLDSEGRLSTSGGANPDKKTIIINSEGELETQLGGYRTTEYIPAVTYTLVDGNDSLNVWSTNSVGWDYEPQMSTLTTDEEIVVHIKGTFLHNAIDEDVTLYWDGSYNYWWNYVTLGSVTDSSFLLYNDYSGAGNTGFCLYNSDSSVDFTDSVMESVTYNVEATSEEIISYADDTLIHFDRKTIAVDDLGVIHTALGGYYSTSEEAPTSETVEIVDAESIVRVDARTYTKPYIKDLNTLTTESEVDLHISFACFDPFSFEDDVTFSYSNDRWTGVKHIDDANIDITFLLYEAGVGAADGCRIISQIDLPISPTVSITHEADPIPIELLLDNSEGTGKPTYILDINDVYWDLTTDLTNVFWLEDRDEVTIHIDADINNDGTVTVVDEDLVFTKLVEEGVTHYEASVTIDDREYTWYIWSEDSGSGNAGIELYGGDRIEETVIRSMEVQVTNIVNEIPNYADSNLIKFDKYTIVVDDDDTIHTVIGGSKKEFTIEPTKLANSLTGSHAASSYIDISLDRSIQDEILKLDSFKAYFKGELDENNFDFSARLVKDKEITSDYYYIGDNLDGTTAGISAVTLSSDLTSTGNSVLHIEFNQISSEFDYTITFIVDETIRNVYNPISVKYVPIDEKSIINDAGRLRTAIGGYKYNTVNIAVDKYDFAKNSYTLYWNTLSKDFISNYINNTNNLYFNVKGFINGEWFEFDQLKLSSTGIGDWYSAKFVVGDYYELKFRVICNSNEVNLQLISDNSDDLTQGDTRLVECSISLNDTLINYVDNEFINIDNETIVLNSEGQLTADFTDTSIDNRTIIKNSEGDLAVPIDNLTLVLNSEGKLVAVPEPLMNGIATEVKYIGSAETVNVLFDNETIVLNSEGELAVIIDNKSLLVNSEGLIEVRALTKEEILAILV